MAVSANRLMAPSIMPSAARRLKSPCSNWRRAVVREYEEIRWSKSPLAPAAKSSTPKISVLASAKIAAVANDLA